MNEVIFEDFTGGWCPSDDDHEGPVNRLLALDNLTLDTNYALTLANGNSVSNPAAITTSLDSTVCDVFSVSVDKNQSNYIGSTNGTITRNGSTIQGKTPVSSIKAAFCSAYNYILCSAGKSSIKSNDVNTFALGLPGCVAPTVAATDPSISAILTPPNWYDSSTSTFRGSTPTTGASSGYPVTTTVYSQIANNNGSSFVGQPITPVDWSMVDGGINNPGDIFSFRVTSNNPNISLANISSIGVQIGLGFGYTPYNSGAGNTGAYTLSDFYQYTIPLSFNTLNNNPFEYNFQIQRQQFNLVSPNGLNWSSVLRIVLTFTFVSGPINATAQGLVLPVSGLQNGGTGWGFYGGANALNGTYQWTQINVRTDGSYQALSAFNLSIPSAQLTLNNSYASITPQNAFLEDPQITESWICRLISGVWYQVKVLNATTGFGAFIDKVSDLVALKTDITINLNLISANNTYGPAEEYIDIIGPIQGRWFYFTPTTMYPSDINDPDLLNASLAIKLAGSIDELIFWAKKVAEGYTLVGTSLDIYMISGTYETLADGTIDITHRPLACQHPPICYDAVFNNGNVYYVAADGARSVNLLGNCSLLSSPALDILYSLNLARYGYPAAGGATHNVPGTTRFPITVANNRLYLGVTGTNRIEVFDFIRGYWRPIITSTIGSCVALTVGYNDYPLGVFNYPGNTPTYYLNFIDSVPALNGQPQTVRLLTKFINATQRYTRFDLYTMKFLVDTGGINVSIQLTFDDGTFVNFIINTNGLKTLAVDIYSLLLAKLGQQPVKPFLFVQMSLVGGALTIFRLAGFTMGVDSNPTQLTSLVLKNNALSAVSPKRMRMWPIVINTLGNMVVATPYADNVPLTPQTIITTDQRTTVPVYILLDAFAVDYKLILTCNNGVFEFWESLAPVFVETLPSQVQFDQIGPFEFFKYGKLREFEIYLMPLLSGTINWTIYFNDDPVTTGSFPVQERKALNQYIGVPKGTSGATIRLELTGLNGLTFCRYLARFAVEVTGSDKTDNCKWVTLPEG